MFGHGDDFPHYSHYSQGSVPGFGRDEKFTQMQCFSARIQRSPAPFGYLPSLTRKPSAEATWVTSPEPVESIGIINYHLFSGKKSFHMARNQNPA
jgi:hypothetical protein